MIPRKSAEPYRNVKNFGILLDLEKIFGESKNRLMSKAMSISVPDKENRNSNNENEIESPDFIEE